MLSSRFRFPEDKHGWVVLGILDAMPLKHVVVVVRLAKYQDVSDI
jgi:hypothetical protein